jgi:hypothetical protein
MRSPQPRCARQASPHPLLQLNGDKPDPHGLSSQEAGAIYVYAPTAALTRPHRRYHSAGGTLCLTRVQLHPRFPLLSRAERRPAQLQARAGPALRAFLAAARVGPTEAPHPLAISAQPQIRAPSFDDMQSPRRVVEHVPHVYVGTRAGNPGLHVPRRYTPSPSH